MAVTVWCAAFILMAVAAVTSPARAADSSLRPKVPGAELRVGRSVLEITFDPDERAVPRAELVEWIRRCASIVAGYYGTFPVPAVTIRIATVDGAGVRNGHASADPAPEINVRVGRSVSREELLRDWVLVHEMTHLALPEVGRAHAWLAEGLATYVEGVARAQAGNLDARELWQEDVASMPKGVPQAGDEGLDHTHTWGRTYWGGAIFCLAADVEIRERSGNRRGLQDALRAILRASGGMATSWPIERVFATGDAATGTSALADLYRSMRDSPTVPDLARLWQRLGVSVDDNVLYLDTAGRPAEIRAAITRPPTAGP